MEERVRDFEQGGDNIVWLYKCRITMKSSLVLQKFTIARKSGSILLDYRTAFFVRHSSEYETSDNDRKVN